MTQVATAYFRKQLSLAATPAAVYRALTTPQGLRSWWTHSCEVDTTVGGKTTLRFGRNSKVMQNIKLSPAREVFWHCIAADLHLPGVARTDEWVGTDIIFKLTALPDGSTRLDFGHVGLTPQLQCYTHCESGWKLFLGSLQKLVETGQGTPFVPGVSDACAA